MGSPYNKMISAKFYVETWVGRLDTFFDTKDIFAPFFDTKDIFLTRTGTGTGPKRGDPRPPGTRPRTTPGVDLTRAQVGEQPPNSPKYHKKRYFSAFFDTKDLFLTRTGTGTGPGRG